MILSSLKNRLRSRTRVTTFKFQSALDLKNRLRSRTRVTTFMFQSALSFKNRLRSRTRVAIPMFDNVASQPASQPAGPENGLKWSWASRRSKSVGFHSSS